MTSSDDATAMIDRATDAAMITVGYDGSSRARRAVEWAAQEATIRNCAVRIVTCFGGPPVHDSVGDTPAVDDRMRSNADAVLDTEVAACRDRHPTTTFEPELLYGTPREHLVVAAKDSDVLVVGTSGHGFLDAWRLGAVAYEVARHAACPVVLVPNVAQDAVHDRVVVAVDGAASDNDGVMWAGDEADRRNAELLVVHVWNYPYASSDPGPAHDLMRVDASLVVQNAVRLARDRVQSPVTGLLLEGSPISELVEQTAGADLLVIGSPGRGELRPLLVGSVAHHVSAHARRPVVVVHPHGGGRHDRDRHRRPGNDRPRRPPPRVASCPTRRRRRPVRPLRPARRRELLLTVLLRIPATRRVLPHARQPGARRCPPRCRIGGTSGRAPCHGGQLLPRAKRKRRAGDGR